MAPLRSLRSLPAEAARHGTARTGAGAARPQAVHEHEFEAAHGLPEPLPRGEHILWQGAPDMRALAGRCFHVRTATLYFGAILLARAVTVIAQGGSALDGAIAVLWLAPAAAIALAMLGLMAYLVARTTVYTITDQRVIMRIGIVLSLTFNIPFTRIDAAAATLKHGPFGDIALSTAGTDHIAYVHLWPHARPWRIARTEPMLRCIADTERVARLLTDAWRTARGAAAAPVAPVTTETAKSDRPLRGAAPTLVRVR